MSTRYLDIDDLVVDNEFEELLPALSMAEFEELEKNILQFGLLDPIKIWQDPSTDKWLIIDGHNRYRIIKKNNLKWNSWCDYKILYEEDLATREDVKRWMLEQQLGRRNLSEVERYEIVQRFKTLFEERAKKNQSAGGKGLTNLTTVNTRKEMAKVTGTSEGTYQKLDKIMKSDNEELKQKLKNKEVSIDKAYRMLKKPSPKKNEEVTPQQQIEKFDNRMNEIDKEISSLRIEREALMRRRSSLFEALDIECELKYQFIEKDGILGSTRYCEFYIEMDGYKEVFVECLVYCDESPNSLWMNKIPEKYKNDFIMLWKKAHREDVEYQNEELDKRNKEFEKQYNDALKNDLKKSKEFYKQCYRVLAKIIHPDNGEGSLEAMQYLNQLKTMWGV